MKTVSILPLFLLVSLFCIIPADDLSNFLASDGLLSVIVGFLSSDAVWRLFVVET